jgi:oxygen-independent coproporphyrinogen-3 oxidase
LSQAGLYIHFPFCRRSCYYCHFFKKKYRPDPAADLIKHIELEMRNRRDPGLAFDTVYFGGGSPSLMAPSQAAKLLDAAGKYFRPSPRTEATLEANPDDLSPAVLKEFLSAGINRLSVGVQSFQDRDLRFLRRTHDAARAIAAIDAARAAGFRNVSLDLIIGLPTQNARTLELNFRRIEEVKPDHVSVYILENVPRPAADERDARLYFQARRALLALGFEHYEVSNFSRPGRASRHNLKYWSIKPYAGFGPSAAGFLDGRDYRNVADLKKYGAALQLGKRPEAPVQKLDPAVRRIVTGLRLLGGIPESAFAAFPSATGFLLSENFLVRRNRAISVPPEKILLLNEILGYFI